MEDSMLSWIIWNCNVQLFLTYKKGSFLWFKITHLFHVDLQEWHFHMVQSNKSAEEITESTEEGKFSALALTLRGQ